MGAASASTPRQNRDVIAARTAACVSRNEGGSGLPFGRRWKPWECQNTASWGTYDPVPLADQVIRMLSPLDVRRQARLEAQKASLAAVAHTAVSKVFRIE